jgi:molecular chaperone DnaK
VPEDLRKEVEEKIRHLRDTMEKDDINAIRRASDELTQASYRLAEMLYRSKTQKGEAGAGSSSEGASKKGGDEVIDADFEEMK